MTLPHFTALKITTLVLGMAAAAVIAMDPTVKVAIIAAIPPTISAFLWGWVNNKKLTTVEKNTNNKLDQVLDQRNAAVSRADKLQGQIEGTKAEQDRMKPKE